MLNLEPVSHVAVSVPVPVPESSFGAWILLLVMCVHGAFVRSLFVRVAL